MIEPVETPTVVTILKVVAWCTIAVSVLVAAAAAAGGAGDVVWGGIGGALSGCLMLVVCVAVEKLCEIEVHLRFLALDRASEQDKTRKAAQLLAQKD